MRVGCWATARRASFTAEMAGRSFVATASLGRRRLQARLANVPGVIDAVIQGSRVRVVTAADTLPVAAGLVAEAPDLTLTPTPPRFEDSFVARLRAQAATPAPPPSATVARRCAGGAEADRRRDRGCPSHPPLRRLRRRGRRQLHRRARRDLRPARRQRRRQIHHLPHAVRPAAAVRRHLARRRLRPAHGRGPGARADRLHGTEILALRRSVGARRTCASSPAPTACPAPASARASTGR